MALQDWKDRKTGRTRSSSGTGAGQEIGLILPPARHHAAAFIFLLSVFGMKQSRAWAAQYYPTTCGLPQNVKRRGPSCPVHSYLQSSSVSSKSVRWRGDASTARGTNGTGAIDGSAFGLAAFCFGADYPYHLPTSGGPRSNPVYGPDDRNRKADDHQVVREAIQGVGA